jgi:hypothetical protein
MSAPDALAARLRDFAPQKYGDPVTFDLLLAAAAALLAAREERDAAVKLNAECAELVDGLRELRAPRDIEEGSLMLNTCDYYALDDLAARLKAARPAPETAE